MLTPRMSSMSVVFNNNIYVLGGMVADNSGTYFLTSNVFEVYNITSNTWTSLPSFPLSGISYANCFYANVSGNNRIYVMCGISNINSSQTFITSSSSIYYYDIDNTSWQSIDVSSSTIDELNINRFGASAFINGDNITVTGGAIPSSSTTNNITLSYLQTSFTLNISTNSLTDTSNNFSILPIKRYSEAYCQNTSQ
jgi:N-acetylneuraminic acid mutarotase